MGCEFSGTIRDQFLEQGCDAYSCDLLPAYDGTRWHKNSRHFQQDVRHLLTPAYHWDLLIVHPPCTHLSYANYRFNPILREESLEFVRFLLAAPVPHICLENPRSVIDTLIMPRTQEIEPWQFGDPYRKPTWLWLKNLPRLQRLMTIKPSQTLRLHNGAHHAGFSRGMRRSITYPGIAAAMARQWSNLPTA